MFRTCAIVARAARQHSHIQTNTVRISSYTWQRAVTPLLKGNKARKFSSWRRGGGRSYNRSLSLNDAMWAIIGTNAAVYGLYQVSDRQLIRQHTVLSLESLTSLRLHTLVTNSFFHHDDIFHLGTNMLNVYILRSLLGQIAFDSAGFRMRGSMGVYFLKLYAAAAVAGSLAHVATGVAQAKLQNPRLFQGRPLNDRYMIASVPPTYGAGAAISGTLAGIMMRLGASSTININFIPLPIWVLFGLFVAQDIARSTSWGDQTKYGDHIGASLAGIALAKLL